VPSNLLYYEFDHRQWIAKHNSTQNPQLSLAIVPENLGLGANKGCLRWGDGKQTSINWRLRG
jgi:hypothetical protein